MDSSLWEGSYNSLALDSSNHPHISYYNYSNSALNYAYHNGSNWEIETVDQDGYEGPYQYTSLALDSANHPHISYYDSGNKDLKYAYYNGFSWGIETVDNNGDAGIYNSLVLDTFDCPFISYSYFTQPYALKYTFKDADGDIIPDGQDNCLHTPNGPDLGTCYSWSGSTAACTSYADCGGASGSCGMAQEDSYPPGGNGCGDACECEGNFDGDLDVDGTDASTFKVDFGRSKLINPCTNGNPCDGDFECDIDVDGTNASKFKSDFGRSKIVNPCPVCPTNPWCVY